MTRVELDRKFKKSGWTIVHGSRHDLAVSPTGQIIALPRHKGDIPKGTAQKILKSAGLK
ncbi:MAG: type II toxin-antitoxin system HicA family toxin [Treponema sp.]|jgi:predicted RNA binding protein YcfA (HicA-like mRNA interferase family)|nr:type II toxin-antitoxin system HicA family toxin [Treponema sp.]